MIKHGIRVCIGGIEADDEDQAIEKAWEAMPIDLNLMLHNIHGQGALDEEAVHDGIEPNTWNVEFYSNEYWFGILTPPEPAHSEQDQAVFNALASIAAASDHLDQAEEAQSTSDPIHGPGSTEWEIVRAILQQAEAALRLATDGDGELERDIPTPETVAERLWKSP